MLQPRFEPDAGTSDEVLAADARDGSRAAFATLVARYQDRVYRLALRMCHNPADAEEIAQESFILAHRGIGTFHGDSRFSTWLYRIAVNQVLMTRRASRRRPARSLEITNHDRGWPVASSSGEPVEGADELLHQKILTQRVRTALARLDDAHRAAIVLRDLEELSAEEAGEILGVSAETVRQRAHRARLKLRELLVDLVSAAPREQHVVARGLPDPGPGSGATRPSACCAA